MAYINRFGQAVFRPGTDSHTPQPSTSQQTAQVQQSGYYRNDLVTYAHPNYTQHTSYQQYGAEPSSKSISLRPAQSNSREIERRNRKLQKTVDIYQKRVQTVHNNFQGRVGDYILIRDKV